MSFWQPMDTAPMAQRMIPTPDQIRTWRKAAGLTQSQAAALGGWARITWAQWESGKRRMHPASWELVKSKASKRS